jgi:gamma-glutamylcyclotransferase (GGCT)/AIG2-like uncharacterized protein YtfP
MRFFFYGTLAEGSANPMARRVRALMEPLGAATVRGALFALADPAGWYPVLVDGDGEVHGQIFAARDAFTAADLAALDAYEDYHPAAPGRSEYARIEVETSRGPAQCYRFNRPLPADALPIRSGDFLRWLAETGNSPFSPGPAA